MKNLLFLLIAYNGIYRSSQVLHGFHRIAIIGMIKTMCANKNDPEFSSRFQIEKQNADTCFEELQRHEVGADRLEEFRTNGSLKEFLKNYSLELTKYHNCSESLYRFGIDCLPLEGREYLNKTAEAVGKVEEYIFGNDAQRTIAFIQDDGFKCVTRNIKNISTCSNLVPFGIREVKPAFCTLSRNFRCCILDIQKRCPGYTYLVDIIDLIMPASCGSNNNTLRGKRDLQDLRLLDHYVDQFIQFFPEMTRPKRETGGLGSKLLHMERSFKDKCEKNVTELERALESMKNCLRRKRMFETPRDMFVRHIDQCSNRSRQLLDKCLPEKNRYFPEMLFRLIESIARLLYDDYDEIARGLTPCVPKLKSKKGEKYYINCTTGGGNVVDNEIPESKEKFCQKFIPITECFVGQIKDMCAQNNDLQKFSKDYLRAMRQPCK